MFFRWTAAVLATFALCRPALAQAAEPATPSPPPPAAAPAACCLVPNGTLVDIVLANPLSSRTIHRGDLFPIKLGSPLKIDGSMVLPAGVEGVGEVIDAAPARAGGAPGKLLLAARYLTWHGTRIPLRGFKLGGSGASKASAALGASLVAGPLAMFVHGGEVELPAGMPGQAKLAADSQLAPLPDSPTPDSGPAAGSATSTSAAAAPAPTPQIPDAPASVTPVPTASAAPASSAPASPAAPAASPSDSTHQE